MKEKPLPILLLVLTFILWGVFDTLYGSSNAASNFLWVAHIVSVAALLFWWTSVDAASRGKNLSGSMGVLIALFGIFAMPFYLSESRPAGSWPKWWLKGVALLAICLVASYIAQTVVSRSTGI